MKQIINLLILLISTSIFAQKKVEKIHFEVDQLATYHGGYENFSKYINENINCKIKINKKEKNQIQLRFIVEKNGVIKHVQIISEKPFVCSDEIKKAVKNAIAWKPAMKNNLPVRSLVQMNINLEK